MPDADHCQKCGADLPLHSASGLCSSCLLKAGDESERQPSAPFRSTSASPLLTAIVPPTAEELAQHFPQLEVLALLGQGGMGAVYKARQPALDRLVAIKILPPAAGRDPAFAERFTREARALARLNHPHIHRADIYSIGVVFYELLTGELPIGRFAPPSKKAEVDVRVDDVVLRALEKEPEHRYQRASDVKSEVPNHRQWMLGSYGRSLRDARSS